MVALRDTPNHSIRETVSNDCSKHLKHFQRRHGTAKVGRTEGYSISQGVQTYIIYFVSNGCVKNKVSAIEITI